MEWISNKYSSLTEFMFSENEIYKDFNTYEQSEIKNLQKAATNIKRCCFEEYKIFIIADYDVDGVASAIIMGTILEYFGVPYETIIPKRFSDGYGISETIISDIIEQKAEKNLVITIDNGITAINHFNLLKENGFETIIIDHHNPLVVEGHIVLPEADIVVDPHIEENNKDDYCAAGLAFKLAEALNLPESEMLNITVFAMFATIADIVKLKRENRKIVKEGLRIVNEERNKLSANLKFFFEMLDIEHIDEDSIAYTIGPTINAPGRLIDDGAQNIAAKALFGPIDFDLFDSMKHCNTERKKLTDSYTTMCIEMINENNIDTNHPIILNGDFHEGIIGIIAGKIAKKYQVPTIITANMQDSDLVKGSARTAQNENLIELLRKNDKFFVKYGGHKEAAGLTMKKSNLESLKEALSEKNYKNSSILFYDLELKIKDLKDFFEKQSLFAPFGNGNRKPLVKISVELSPRNNEVYRELSCGKYAKLYGNGCDIMLFECDDYMYDTSYEKWIDLGRPNKFEALAYVTENVFRENHILQLMVVDLKINNENENHKEKSEREIFLSYFS